MDNFCEPLTGKQRAWMGHLTACAELGVSMSSYAKTKGLDCRQFYAAKSLLVKKGAWQSNERVAFTPVVIEPHTSLCRVVLVNGIVIECPSQLLSQVLASVG